MKVSAAEDTLTTSTPVTTAATPVTRAAAPVTVKSAAAPAAVTPAATPVTVTSAATQQSSVVYIDPTAAPGGTGSITSPYNNWSFVLKPGVTYLQRAGTTFTGVIQVDNVVASAAAPTLIGAYGTGSAPTIVGSVAFTGSSNVEFGGFQMTNPSGAAVIIQQGSSNIEVANNAIIGAKQGIWVGNYAGGGNVVEDNYILNSKGVGISVDSTTSNASAETHIIGNSVLASGADGILLSTNYADITGNTVAYSGLTAPATSGIHVFTNSATAGTGQDNTISDNLVGYNRDATMQDGNGILLDQWTGGNAVSDNFVLGNDGAGIALYDSSMNFISDNVTGANGVNSGGSHSTLAELTLNQSLGLTTNNVITGNTFLAFLPTGFAAFVDTGSTNAGNVISGNVLENLIGPNVYQVNGIRGASVANWNSMLGASDKLSGVAVATPNANTIYDYTFPAGTTLNLDGHVTQLTGWSTSGGLFGTT